MLRNKRIRSMFLYDPDKGAGDPPPTPPTGAGKVEFTAEQQAHIDKLIGERGKRADEGLLKDFLKSVGFEKQDDLKAALVEFKKTKDAQLSDLEKATAELDEQKKRVTELQSSTSELATLKQQQEKYDAALQAQIKKQTEGLPAHILTLLEKMSPLEQFNYLTENAEALGKKPDPIPPTPPAGGKGGEKDAADSYLNKTYGTKGKKE